MSGRKAQVDRGYTVFPFQRLAIVATIPDMTSSSLSYIPSFAEETICKELDRLSVPGPLRDDDLARRSFRLAERFRLYAACSPHGMWAPGLILTHEMRSLAEQYLPLAEISCALERLIGRALRVKPVLAGSAIRTAGTWLDLLDQLQPLVRHPDPGRLLAELVADGEERRRFLWRIFLPPRYGCDFNRYPAQEGFLRRWLSEDRLSLGGTVRCLDAACGTGEGTWGLVRVVHEVMAGRREWEVKGMTLEPLELFSAAHGYFPHDPLRQALFRSRVEPFLAMVHARRITFSQGDLTVAGNTSGPGYDVIVCNGVLGGPFLHDNLQLAVVVANLARLLAPGGVLLAADRFHGGWKKRVSRDDLRDLLGGCGLRPLAIEEGVGGVKASA